MSSLALTPLSAQDSRDRATDLAHTILETELASGADVSLASDVAAQAMMGILEAKGYNLAPEWELRLASVIERVFAEVVPTDDWVDALTPLYLQHFTEQDLEEIVRWQRSAVGKKVASSQAMLVSEGAAIGRELMASRQALSTKRFLEELEEEIPDSLIPAPQSADSQVSQAPHLTPEDASTFREVVHGHIMYP